MSPLLLARQLANHFALSTLTETMCLAKCCSQAVQAMVASALSPTTTEAAPSGFWSEAFKLILIFWLVLAAMLPVRSAAGAHTRAGVLPRSPRLRMVSVRVPRVAGARVVMQRALHQWRSLRAVSGRDGCCS